MCMHILCRNKGVRKAIREIDAKELVLVPDKSFPEFSKNS